MPGLHLIVCMRQSTGTEFPAFWIATRTSQYTRKEFILLLWGYEIWISMEERRQCQGQHLCGKNMEDFEICTGVHSRLCNIWRAWRGTGAVTANFKGVRLYVALGYQISNEVHGDGCFLSNMVKKQFPREGTAWSPYFVCCRIVKELSSKQWKNT